MLIDTKIPYFGPDGRLLAGGRLRFYKFGTTVPATVYGDPQHLIPYPGRVSLTSAGWSPTELHSDEDLDCRADEWLGLDDDGLEIYEEVKAFRYIPGASSGSGSGSGSLAVVETTADLRSLSTDFGSAMVLGYYAKGDSPARIYIVSDAFAVDDGGTVIQSITAPEKYWHWQPEGSSVDCRTYGVFADPNLHVNSALANLLAYCEQSTVAAEFTPGAYYLTPGSLATGAAVSAASGVTLNCSGGAYTLQLSNPRFSVKDTFAGTNVELLLAGAGWEQTLVPTTAFSNGAYSRGTAHYRLHVTTATPLVFASGQIYSEIVVERGLSVPVAVSAEVHAGTISGAGQLAYQTSDTVYTQTLRTSSVSLRCAYAMQRAQLVYVDSDIALQPGHDSSCAIIDAGGTIENAPLTSGGARAILRGAISCRPGFLKGSTGFVMFGAINVEHFATAEGAVNTWISSPDSYPDLDLRGIGCRLEITRSGTIHNGEVGAITADSLRLYNVNVFGPVELGSLVAEGCEITSYSYNVGNGSLKRCTLSSTGTTPPAPELSSHILEDVTISSPYVRVTGGGAVWRNVNAKTVRLVPSGTTFGNFDWVGGAATSVIFDASVSLVTSDAVCYNVVIQHLKNLSVGISSVNGLSKKWATAGHYNVRIGDNEAGKATYGTTTVELVKTNSTYSEWRVYLAYLNKLFSFNPGEKGFGCSLYARAFRSTISPENFRPLRCDIFPAVDRADSNKIQIEVDRYDGSDLPVDRAHVTFNQYGNA